jgi:hypothetical protein
MVGKKGTTVPCFRTVLMTLVPAPPFPPENADPKAVVDVTLLIKAGVEARSYDEVGRGRAAALFLLILSWSFVPDEHTSCTPAAGQGGEAQAHGADTAQA